MNKVITSINNVKDKCEHVSIDKGALEAFASTIDITSKYNWMDHSPVKFSGRLDRRLSYLFIFNAISFCYWNDEGGWRRSYDGKQYDRGMWSMLDAIETIKSDEHPLHNPEYIRGLDVNHAKMMFKGNSRLQLIEERVAILKDIGEKIIKNFKGRYENVLIESGYDALKLVDIVTENFIGYRDESMYKGEKVIFNKKAQLLAADIDRHLHNNRIRRSLTRCDELTGCADYRLPLVLENNGVLVYDDELKNMITGGSLIEPGSRMENEIRIKTIEAVHMLSQILKLPQMTINDYLWIAPVNDVGMLHKTLTTKY